MILAQYILNASSNTSARQVAMSVRSITRLFRAELHITLIQYLKMLRINRVMELVEATDLNMTEIAYEIGYSNISVFSNTFRQLSNMRPTEFKKK